jgi:hypothetical protein
MPKQKRIGSCTYCGKQSELTDDHIPPKCLFPPAERKNLLTVPACGSCNLGFSKDDEYFRLMLSIRIDLPNTEAANYIKDSAMRSLRRNEATRFRHALKSSLKRVPYHTQAGIYIGHVPAMQIDGNRLRRTCERMVKGFYAHYMKRSVPSTHEVKAVIFDFQRDESALNDPEVQDMLRSLGKANNHHVFGSVLHIWYALADDDQDSSLWCVWMHKVFTYLGFTTPVEA